MSALPKNLVPMPKQSQVAGIKSQTLEINPTNGSSSTVYDQTNNRLIFQIGSIPNGFLNTKKSFIKFDLKVTSATPNTTFVPAGIPIFNRMIVKTGSGSVLEDIQDLDVYDRLTLNMENYSTSSVKNALLGWGASDSDNATLQHAAGGTTYVKPLPSGVLGKEQEFYLPLHLMGSTYAFEVELQLAPATSVINRVSGGTDTTASYTINNVSLQLEVVNMPEDVCRKLDLAICGGEALRIPYSEVKAYRNNVPSGVLRHSVQTHEVSPNVEKVMTVMRPSTIAFGDDKFKFFGGKKSGSTGIVDEYQYRYADRYAPLQPAKTGVNSNGALANIVREVGFEAMPWFATTGANGDSRYAIDSFFLLQDFQTDPDLVSGLSTMAHASPIESYLTFTAPTGSALSLSTFAKSTNALEISGNGVASKGMIM